MLVNVSSIHLNIVTRYFILWYSLKVQVTNYSVGWFNYLINVQETLCRYIKLWQKCKCVSVCVIVSYLKKRWITAATRKPSLMYMLEDICPSHDLNSWPEQRLQQSQGISSRYRFYTLSHLEGTKRKILTDWLWNARYRSRSKEKISAAQIRREEDIVTIGFSLIHFNILSSSISLTGPHSDRVWNGLCAWDKTILCLIADYWQRQHQPRIHSNQSSRP